MRIPAPIHQAMLAHARFEFPNEACGLLAVDGSGELRMCYSLTNADRSPVSFTVEPTEHFRAMQHAERNGWEIAGVFHSHTHSEAVPSATDSRQALEPDWLYVLIGPSASDRPEVRAYRIVDGLMTEEPLGVE